MKIVLKRKPRKVAIQYEAPNFCIANSKIGNCFYCIKTISQPRLIFRYRFEVRCR